MLRLLAALLIPAIGIFINHSVVWIPVSWEHYIPAMLLIGSAFVQMGGAAVFIVLFNVLVWPWLNFSDMVKGEGTFKGKSDVIRAATILAWGLIIAAFAFGFANAGV